MTFISRFMSSACLTSSVTLENGDDGPEVDSLCVTIFEMEFLLQL